MVERSKLETSNLDASASLYLRHSTLPNSPSGVANSSSRSHSLSRNGLEPILTNGSTLLPSSSTFPPPSVDLVSSDIALPAKGESFVKRSSRQRKMAAADVQEILRRRGSPKTNRLQIHQLSQTKPKIVLSPIVSQAFEQSLKQVHDEMEGDDIDIEMWLRVANWWLLKVNSMHSAAQIQFC